MNIASLCHMEVRLFLFHKTTKQLGAGAGAGPTRNGTSSLVKFERQTHNQTRIDVYETLCPKQMLVHKGGKIKNWAGECYKLQSQYIFKESTGGGGVGLEGSGWM